MISAGFIYFSFLFSDPGCADRTLPGSVLCMCDPLFGNLTYHRCNKYVFRKSVNFCSLPFRSLYCPEISWQKPEFHAD